MPVLVLSLLGQAAVQVPTKPWPWLFFLGWIAVSKFDFGLFAEEVRRTIFNLWWLVVLVLLVSIIREYIRIRLGGKG